MPACPPPPAPGTRRTAAGSPPRAHPVVSNIIMMHTRQHRSRHSSIAAELCSISRESEGNVSTVDSFIYLTFRDSEIDPLMTSVISAYDGGHAGVMFFL